MKRYVTEGIGSFVLIFFSCGVMMLVGTSAEQGTGYLLSALSVGLPILVMWYSIGEISGCHLNPAISIASLIDKRLGVLECILYILSQLIGAILGMSILCTLFDKAFINDVTGAYNTSTISDIYDNNVVGIVLEIILTAVIVIVYLYCSEQNNKCKKPGICITATYIMVNMIGIGTVKGIANISASVSTAFVAALKGDTANLSCLWIFVLGPVLGAVIASIFYKVIKNSSEDSTP